jgi:type II secretory pathway pseudopilin PulG
LRRSSRRSAAGLTLVEVLAAIMLMGTVLVSVLIASGRQRAQAAGAERRMEACRVADDLLDRWWSDPEGMPPTGQGPVPGRDGWRWRTQATTDEGARILGARVVALEITESGHATALVRVEVLRLTEGGASEPQG